MIWLDKIQHQEMWILYKESLFLLLFFIFVINMARYTYLYFMMSIITNEVGNSLWGFLHMKSV